MYKRKLPILLNLEILNHFQLCFFDLSSDQRAQDCFLASVDWELRYRVRTSGNHGETLVAARV
ncbi:hypothetical protein EMEDMD4_670005 [Sinorhizobium medicae]|uniref:Uncharacterized protein n=1 Tax=Sinorhizobium medicae TaxID=110321 RepID=A0A508X974_9HYPH|nr:hypothetical protein EMEDMD4_670005 [Sinorhizobium medicae]